jgi:hypothetical protein
MPRKIHLTIRCESCDSKKTSIKVNSTLSADNQYSLTGGVVGGFIAGIPGVIAGALLGGKTNVHQDLSVQCECEECGHSSNTFTLENDEGETLDEYEFRSLLEDKDEDDEIFFSAHIEKDPDSDF